MLANIGQRFLRDPVEDGAGFPLRLLLDACLEVVLGASVEFRLLRQGEVKRSHKALWIQDVRGEART